jgi:hypothetical protein
MTAVALASHFALPEVHQDVMDSQLKAFYANTTRPLERVNQAGSSATLASQENHKVCFPSSNKQSFEKPLKDVY